MPRNRLIRFAGRWLAAAVLAVAGTFTAVAAPPNPYEGRSAAASHNQIDDIVFARLDKLGIQPANNTPDTVFMRRVYLDTIGTLPTEAEVLAFLNDRSPDKRDGLIEKLLARDEFADYWAMKWCDLLRVKSEFPINLWPNAVQAYDHWIRASLRQNLPYDRFARELLTSNGSNFRVAQVNFYRAVQSKEPATLAQAVALTFMGVRADKWPSDKLGSMAAFFSQVGYKATAEWKEEIVFFDPGKAGAQIPTLFPDGTKAVLAPDQDPRELFANWLITPKNPWFTRNIANRVWSWRPTSLILRKS